MTFELSQELTSMSTKENNFKLKIWKTELRLNHSYFLEPPTVLMSYLILKTVYLG